jgi:ubiquinone/menaquinone biosynthesis C-methylase UbiE
MTDTVKKYWDEKIKIWSQTSYNRCRVKGIVNKVLGIFRKSVDARLQTAIAVLAPHVKGKAVLDLGSGLGHLGFALLEQGCSRYIGIDISEEAIKECRQKADSMRLSERMEFTCADIAALQRFPVADISVGLGLLDWFTLRDVDTIVRKLEGRRILLTFSEQDNSIAEIIHRFYLVKRLQWKNAGVYAYHFKRSEIAEILKRHGFEHVTYVKNRKMRFGVMFHNLEDAEK